MIIFAGGLKMHWWKDTSINNKVHALCQERKTECCLRFILPPPRERMVRIHILENWGVHTFFCWYFNEVSLLCLTCWYIVSCGKWHLFEKCHYLFATVKQVVLLSKVPSLQDRKMPSYMVKQVVLLLEITSPSYDMMLPC